MIAQQNKCSKLLIAYLAPQFWTGFLMATHFFSEMEHRLTKRALESWYCMTYDLLVETKKNVKVAILHDASLPQPTLWYLILCLLEKESLHIEHGKLFAPVLRVTIFAFESSAISCNSEDSVAVICSNSLSSSSSGYSCLTLISSAGSSTSSASSCFDVSSWECYIWKRERLQVVIQWFTITIRVEATFLVAMERIYHWIFNFFYWSLSQNFTLTLCLNYLSFY